MGVAHRQTYLVPTHLRCEIQRTLNRLFNVTFVVVRKASCKHLVTTAYSTYLTLDPVLCISSRNRHHRYHRRHSSASQFGEYFINMRWCRMAEEGRGCAKVRPRRNANSSLANRCVGAKSFTRREILWPYIFFRIRVCARLPFMTLTDLVSVSTNSSPLSPDHLTDRWSS